MEMRFETTKVILFIVVNVILFFLLYNIPISNNTLLENLCLYKNLIGKECINCGMTRSFLCIMHGNFSAAFNYNRNCFIVFPIIMLTYLYYWYKYIIKKSA